jgi:hypothetical protein
MRAGMISKLFVSQFVLEEAALGDPVLAHRRLQKLAAIPSLPATAAIVDLGRDLIREGALPGKAVVDALQLAVATIYGVEYLLTWNCRHLANAELQRAAKSILLRRGFDAPIVCTPEELMGGGV